MVRRAADTARYELQWALNTAFMCGIVIGVFSEDVLVGVLVCYPPNSSNSGSMLSDMYNSMALGPAPVDLHRSDWGLKPKLRDEAWDNYAEVHHEAVMNMRPHWYVELLGVNPNFQGCGYGKRLLSIILSAADATRHPTFLETESDFNEKIYQKYGFVTMDKGEIRTSDPTIPPFRSVYLMVREYDEARTEQPKLKKTLQGVLPIGNSASTILTKNKRSMKFPGTPTASNSNALANKNTADCDRSVVPPM